MNESQAGILNDYQEAVEQLILNTVVGEEGEHLWDNYQKVTANLLRLTEIHNEISSLEIWGEDWPELKKFRTLIVDPTVERLEKVAVFESRKITARGIEKDLDR